MKIDKLRNGYYPVAWAYLRPIGLAGRHFGISKLQLFKYKWKGTPKNFLLNNRIPYVYYEFIWPYHTEYNGFLSVQVLSVEKPMINTVPRNPNHLFEVEKGERELPTITKKVEEEVYDQEFLEKDVQLLKRKRFFDEECHLPNKILFKFQTAEQGCLKLAFSPNGIYLAAACTNIYNKTVIKIFNIESGQLCFTFKGHKTLIHDLDWSQDSKFLISVSGDYTAKLWEIPLENEDVDEAESEKIALKAVLNHPGYVFAGKIMPERTKSQRKICATGCFDVKVRIWLFETDIHDNYLSHKCEDELIVTTDPSGNYTPFTNLLDHRHPNCLAFDSNNKLYCGDTLGAIHVWDIQVQFRNLHINKLTIITQDEMDGDPINWLGITQNASKIIVHSRDNCIRTLEVDQKKLMHKITNRFFGSKSSKYDVKSTMSPDGNYLMAGSEDGKPYLWDLESAIQIDSNAFEVSFQGCVSDVAWNNSYHMVALSGFGTHSKLQSGEYPILVYCWERSEDFNVIEYKNLIEKLQKEKNEGGFSNEYGNYHEGGYGGYDRNYNRGMYEKDNYHDGRNVVPIKSNKKDDGMLYGRDPYNFDGNYDVRQPQTFDPNYKSNENYSEPGIKLVRKNI